MKVQNVRFGPDQWELIQRGAALTGSTTAHFVRESAFARAISIVLLDELGFNEFPDLDISAVKLRLSAYFANHPEIRQQVLDALHTSPENLLKAAQQAPPSPEDPGEAKGSGTRKKPRRT